MKRTDFEERIALFGLDKEKKKLGDFKVPDNHTVYLSRAKPTIPGARWIKDAGRVMKPKDFAQLKQWIGIPDATAAKIPHAPKFKSRRSSEHLVPHLDHRSKVEYAQAYVFGDASRLPLMGLDISEILRHIVIHFARDIIVGHDAKLVYGPDNHAIQARNIRIYTGGQILVNSYMSIACSSIEANLA